MNSLSPNMTSIQDSLTLLSRKNTTSERLAQNLGSLNAAPLASYSLCHSFRILVLKLASLDVLERVCSIGWRSTAGLNLEIFLLLLV